MECDICLIEWDSKIIIPRLLNCGHTFCEVCLITLFQKEKLKNIEFACPTCKCKQNDIENEDDVRKMIKNYNLLRIVEKLEKTSGYSLSMSKVFNDNIERLSNPFSKFKELKECNDLNSDYKCNKHNLKAYFNSIGTNLLLCRKCLEDGSFKVYPLSGVLREFKRKCNSTMIKINLLNTEIDRLQDFFYSYEDEFFKENKRKLDSLFEYIHKIVQYNYNSSLHILNQCKKEQNEQISTRISELNELKLDLSNLETELNKIITDDYSEILKNNEKLNNIKSNLDNFLNYSSELNLLSMKIGIKEEFKDSLINTIQESYFLDVEFTSIKGEKPLIQHILQKDRNWICVCGESNNNIASLYCNICGLVRKLESYKNLLTLPMEVSTEEINQLISRKNEECKIFTNYLNEQYIEDISYVLEMEWFLNWKCFVTNDITEKYLSNSKKNLSINNFIGVLDPGPIMNYSLLDNVEKEYSDVRFKKGLKKNEDYLIISRDLWLFFYKNYGGGPEIFIKNNEEIYSASINFKNEGTLNLSYKRSFTDGEITSYENTENIMTEEDISIKRNLIQCSPMQHEVIYSLVLNDSEKKHPLKEK